MMKFFLPFMGVLNNSTHHDLKISLKYFKKFSNNIAGIYFSNFLYDIKSTSINLDFLNSSKDFISERFFTLNPPKPLINQEAFKIVDKIIDTYHDLITGFTVSNLYLAEYINNKNPNYKIDISTNTLLHNPIQAVNWKNYCNLHSVNVPRNFARDEEKLKEYSYILKKESIKLKLLLNTSCVYGCPFEINCTYVNGDQFCTMHPNPINLLKANWISPSRSNELSEYIDYGKLAHRYNSIEYLFNCLEHYINVDDNIGLLDLTSSSYAWSLYNNSESYKKYNILISKIPKKIYNCKCQKCKSNGLGNCEICEKFIEHYTK